MPPLDPIASGTQRGVKQLVLKDTRFVRCAIYIYIYDGDDDDV